MNDNQKIAVQAEGLCVRYRYQDPPVLRELAMTVAAGEVVAIMGPSGCGKSSLLTHLAGLRRPEAGLIHLSEQALHDLSAGELDALRAKQLGFVFQQAYLLPYLTVQENILLALEPLDEAAATEGKARLPAMLSELQLSELSKRKAGELSVGQAQRVAVIRALIKNPPIVFADEPTGALDGDNVMAITRLLTASNDENDTQRTAIIATHDERVASQCDRVVKLSAGQIVNV